MIRRAENANPGVLTFRRWSRNCAAAFRTIGRTVRIGVLPMAYTLLTFGQHVHAQVAQPQMLRAHSIDSVLVARERQVADLALSEPSIRIVSVDHLSLAGCKTLHEVLATVPGLDLRPRGSNGIQADLQIRGGGFDQVLIMLNGIDLTDAQTGHHNLNIPIRSEAIAYIEILSGPGGRLFGPGAYAGAINIVTKQPEQTHGQLAAQIASHDTRSGFASAGYRTDRAAIYAYAAGGSSNGFTRNSDYLTYDALATAQLRPTVGTIDLQLGHQAKDFGANSFYTPKYPNQYEAIKSTVASLRYTAQWQGWKGQLSFAYREHQDRFELFRDSAPSWYKGHNHHLSHLYQGRAALEYRIHGWTSSVALIARHDEILSTNLGTQASKRRRIRGAADQFYSRFGARTNLTASFEEQFRWQGLRISAGVMATRNNAFGWAYGYGLDASHVWPQGLQVHAAINRTYRLPTFTDLYYESATRVGNPDLRPERATTYEAAVGYVSQPFRVRLGAYYRMGANIIDWVEAQKGVGVFHAKNHARVNSLGVELSAAYYPHLRFLRGLTLSYAYGYVNSPHRRPWGGSYTFDNLINAASFQGSFPIISNLLLHAVMRMEQRDGEYTDYATQKSQAYPINFLLDAKLEYAFTWCNLFAGVKNILDHPVVGYANVPQPGRILELGVEMQFGR